MTDWVNKGVNAYNAIDKAVKMVNGEDQKEDRSFIERIVDKGSLQDIQKYEKDMTAQEAKKAWENYNTRKRIREGK
jgi:CRISPR/Cas system CSM-associated protein Csm5 (group 7 of RAMP superfamily)